MRIRLMALGLACLLGCSAAPEEAAPAAVSSVPAASVDTAALTQGIDALGYQLLGELGTTAENQMVSPVSIGLLLTELSQGAAGASAEQLAHLLGEQAGAAGVRLRTDLAAPREGGTLTLADSLWVREEFAGQLLPTFTDRLTGAVHPLDFSAPTASATINQWVANATEGQIPTLIESVDPDTMLYLISAVHFQGSWQTAFDPEQTLEQPFYAPAGERPVRMMQQQGSYPYLETANWQAAILPFADGRTELLLCLPREGAQLTLAQLPEVFAQLETQASPQTLRIALPKLDLSAGSDLSAPLGAMGLDSLFDPELADFSGMTGDRSLFVGKMAHQVRFALDETGAQAAGATSAELRKRSAPITIPLQVNRPFYFAVRDRERGLNLFCGWIANP